MSDTKSHGIRYDWDKTAVWHEETDCGVFPVELDKVYRTYRGVRLADLLDIWPEDALRADVIKMAKFWLTTREKRGFELLHAPDDIRLWGPYKHRDWDGHGRASALAAVGWTETEVLDSGMADFLLQATFKTSRVTQIEDYDLVVGAAALKKAAYDQYIRDLEAKHEEMDAIFKDAEYEE